MRDTTTDGLMFKRPIPQGSAPPALDAFWTEEYGWLVPEQTNATEIDALRGFAAYVFGFCGGDNDKERHLRAMSKLLLDWDKLQMRPSQFREAIKRISNLAGIDINEEERR